MRNSHIDSLNRILGRTFGLYVQTHGYHWNVEGPQFRQFHALFEEQYQNLWQALDPVAERIRAMDAYAPGSLTELVALAGDGPAPVQSATEMMDTLIEAHGSMAAELGEAIALSQEAGDEPSAGMLTDRLEWHEQQLWMMKASRK